HPFPARASKCGHIMSAFDQGPQDHNLSQTHGPVLVVPPQQPKPGKWELWRRRIFLIVFVLFCLEIGIILTVAPWTSFWLNNSLILSYPQVREVLAYPFVRGLISGLGIADVWLAVAEVVQYSEP
ncbi:MAG: hypothetical protein WCC25_15550, partial [Candidatus Korobacteraceae bacterium]